MRKYWLKALSLIALLAISAAPAGGDEIAVGGVIIYSGSDVERFLLSEGGVSYIAFPGVRMWALSREHEPYFPMPLEEVVAAVEDVEFPVGRMPIHILILPDPRRDLVSSSAEGFVIFLTPGRVPYPTEHVHYTVVHELGHVVQHMLMPDSRGDLWETYLDLRGIRGLDVEPGAHASRPHEVFAEDFRVLFGGEYARCGGEVENHGLAPPGEVQGLKEFFLSLVDSWHGDGRLALYPNPFQSGLVVCGIGLGETAVIYEVDVHDVAGRMIRRIRPAGSDRSRVVWDGKDDSGRAVAPGLYLTTVTTADGMSVHKVIRAPR